MTNTNDGSKVFLDKTIPTLEVVELTINNKNSNHASIGDELIIKATASEGIISKKILINGLPLNYIDLTEKQFYASYVFKDTDNNGIIEFEISFSDSSGNQGEVVNLQLIVVKLFLIKYLHQTLQQEQLRHKVALLEKKVGIQQTLIY